MGASIGLALAIYGAASLLLGLARPGTQARPWCAAWLCPEEFSDRRASELIRQSPGGGALNELRRALILDSASAYRWANLGDGLFNAGNLPSARYSFVRAVAAGPGNPAILMRAVNFSFSAGDLRQMMQYGAAILSNSQLTDYYTPVFLTYGRAGVPIEEILARGIPAQRVAAQAFLRFLMEGSQVGDAAAAWNWIAERGFYDDRLTADYIAFLLRNQQAARAAGTWVRLNPDMRDYRRTNWIYDGSFEEAPRSSPLDWHVEASPGVEATRTNEAAHDGHWALKLVFDGTTNIDYHGAGQQVVLTKGRWHFEGFIKTDGITTDQGVGLRIYGTTEPENIDTKSQRLTGTQNWTKVEETLDIRQETAVLRVEVIREASRKFDNKIAGKAWIDSIRIEPAAGAR